MDEFDKQFNKQFNSVRRMTCITTAFTMAVFVFGGVFCIWVVVKLMQYFGIV